MKQLLPFILILLVVGSGCKKFIEEQQEKVLMNAITNGTWYIEEYRENTTDITSSFSDYEFQFNKDGTLQGKRAGLDPDNGTWQASMQNASITAQFPSAIDPLKKVNGLWKITDSYMNYVEAEMKVADGKKFLHLRKK